VNFRCEPSSASLNALREVGTARGREVGDCLVEMVVGTLGSEIDLRFRKGT
jgi:hypothetical protein